MVGWVSSTKTPEVKATFHSVCRHLVSTQTCTINILIIQNGAWKRNEVEKSNSKRDRCQWEGELIFDI